MRSGGRSFANGTCASGLAEAALRSERRSLQRAEVLGLMSAIPNWVRSISAVERREAFPLQGERERARGLAIAATRERQTGQPRRLGVRS